MDLLARPDAPAAVAERRRNRPDRVLPITMIALSGLGLLMIYSATRVALERNNLPPSVSMERQLVFVTAGLIAYYAISRFDYREFRHMVGGIYLAVLAGLALVFLFAPVNGAQRWINLSTFQVQPAEFAKVAAVLILAAVLARPQERLTWGRIGTVLGLLVVPSIVIFLQPDLGTMLVFGFLAMVMLFGGGISGRQTLVLSGVAVLVVAAIVRFDLLADYQIDRVRVLIDSNVDPQGVGYTIRQSYLAIGSGQLTGKGLFQGYQTNFEFVPEQGSDFIFTAVAEQLGFVGGLLVIAAYLVIVWRLLVIASNARDRFGALVGLGVAAMFVFHVFVNVGMTVGIMPITGLPLPFMSAGGSSYLAFSIALGIANSIWLRRSPVPGESYIL
jgi:rod shape determining protein RodA